MPTDDATTPPSPEDLAWQEYLERWPEHRMRWYHWPLLLIENSIDGERLRTSLLTVSLVAVAFFFLREPIQHFAEGLAGR